MTWEQYGATLVLLLIHLRVAWAILQPRHREPARSVTSDLAPAR
jgi:hypothetical protein